MVTIGHFGAEACTGTITTTTEAESPEKVKLMKIRQIVPNESCPICSMPLTRIVSIQSLADNLPRE